MVEQKLLLSVVGIIFMAMQFVFYIVSRNTTNKIIKAINEGTKTFNDHVVEGTKTYVKVRKLVEEHDVKDSDGRPMWYMPHSMVETQEKLVEITRTIAATQQILATTNARVESKIDEHAKECRNKP